MLLTFVSMALCQAQSVSWSQKASLPGLGRTGADGFTLNGNGYLVGGLSVNNQFHTEMWKWNKSSNTWTQKANLPGQARHSHVAFKLGSKGYVATGRISSGYTVNDLWEYNSSTNVWTQKLNFSGAARCFASAFVVGNYAYVGMGFTPYQKDLWRYDPGNNSWTQMAGLPGAARQSAGGFAINNYGYIVCGFTGVPQKELWRYNTSSNSWSLRAEFPGSARYAVCAFVLNGKAYVGTGTSASGNTKDFYCYDPASDSWTPAAPLPSNERQSASVFTINGKGYVSCGGNVSVYYNDLWEYNPNALFAYATGTNINCSGQNSGTATAVVSGGTGPYSFLWSSGQVSAVITNIGAGTYTVTVSDANGTTVTASVTLATPNAMSVSTALVSPICKGDSATLSVTVTGGSPPYSYSWVPSNQTNQVVKVAPSTSTTYTVIVNDVNGCTSSATVWVAVNSLPGAPIHVTGGGVACSPDSVKLYTSSNSSLSWQWIRNGINISGAVDSVYYAKTTGTYKVKVTNSNGCSKVSATTSVNISQLNASVSPAGTLSMCQGDSVNLTAIPSSGYNFQWRKNGVNISGATQSVYKAKQAGTYKVLITNASSGCSGLSAGTSIIINCRNLVNQLSDQVSPNPTSETFNLDLTTFEKTGPVELELTDVSGRFAKRYMVFDGGANFTFGRDLVPGIYFLKMRSVSGLQTIKIVKL